MRKWMLILLMLAAVSCGKPSLCCRVTLQLESSRPIVALSIDNSLEGNYFRNLNTGENYNYPLFVNGQCEIEVLKGIYVMAFDGVAAAADGKSWRVRMVQHASAREAVALTEDTAVVTLQLMELQ